MSYAKLNHIFTQYYILRVNLYSKMGAEQPKKIAKVTKAQIDIGALKARIHLELFRDRKNNEIIKGEKELVAKIKGKTRNKTQEILLAERVVNGLKLAQACNLLIGYAASLRGQAHFISENMNNPQKMEPWLPMIYSLIYAADHLGLSSLAEFKALMRALNDPVAVQKYVNPEIINALSPTPSPQQINIYMLELSERNQIPLEEINIIGHKFTHQWKNIPSVPSIPSIPGDTSFDDLGKKLDQEMKNKYDPNNLNPYAQQANQGNPYGNQGNPYGNFNNQGYNPNQGNPYANQGGYVPNVPTVPGYNPNTPNNQGYNPNVSNNQGYNPTVPINQGFSNNPNPNNQANFNPYNQNNNFGGNSPNGGNAFIGNNNANTINPSNSPANLGPNFYVPADITPINKPSNPRSSINSINDIDYYPEIDSQGPLFNKGGFSDPTFDQICEKLKKGI